MYPLSVCYVYRERLPVSTIDWNKQFKGYHTCVSFLVYVKNKWGVILFAMYTERGYQTESLL